MNIRLLSIFLLIFSSSLASAQQGADLGLGASGSPILCRVNEGNAALASADAKGNYFACNREGSVMVASAAGAAEVGKLEDSASASGDLLLGIAAAREDALTINTSTTGDYTPVKTDNAGRLITSFAPPGEQIVGCNSAITTAATGSMLAADASNVFYISSWNCTNTGGAATRVILENGDGTDYANTILPATTGFSAMAFPVAIRLGGLNKAAQVNVITTGSSTICCINGYKSVS